MSKVKSGPRASVRKVRFERRFPAADEVAITGDFAGWDPEGIPLHHDGEANWYATLELLPGEYQYRLRVDGEWRDDPEAEVRVPNPFGSENGVLRVR
jgi:1,4-alpha-glucan branching enzyme